MDVRGESVPAAFSDCSLAPCKVWSITRPWGKEILVTSMQEGLCYGTTLQLIPSDREFLIYVFLDDFSSTSISNALFSLRGLSQSAGLRKLWEGLGEEKPAAQMVKNGSLWSVRVVWV